MPNYFKYCQYSYRAIKCHPGWSVLFVLFTAFCFGKKKHIWFAYEGSIKQGKGARQATHDLNIHVFPFFHVHHGHQLLIFFRGVYYHHTAVPMVLYNSYSANIEKNIWVLGFFFKSLFHTILECWITNLPHCYNIFCKSGRAQTSRVPSQMQLANYHIFSLCSPPV